MSAANNASVVGYTSSHIDGAGRGADITIDVEKLTLAEGGNIDSSSYGSGQGGKLTVSAADSISLSGESLYKSGLSANALGSGSAGDLKVATPSLIISNGGVITGEVGPNADAESHGADVTVEVGSLEIRNGRGIETPNYGAGQGGNLSVFATDQILISGDSEYISTITSNTEGSGDAGHISISASYLRLDKWGNVYSVSEGPSHEASGRAGDIAICADTLEITDHGFIYSTSFGEGKAGDIGIFSTNRILLDGSSDDDHGNSAHIDSDGRPGDAGHIRITTPELTLTNSANITSNTKDGVAGDIVIDTDRLTFTGGMISAATRGSGQAGNIRISATDSIFMAGNPESDEPFDKVSLINSATSGSGKAGNIDISAPTLSLGEGGWITAESGEESSGKGGDIQIDVDHLRLTNDAVITTESGGYGNAGDITMELSTLNLESGASVSSASKATNSGGEAGTITIAKKIEKEMTARLSLSALLIQSH